MESYLQCFSLITLVDIKKFDPYTEDMVNEGHVDEDILAMSIKITNVGVRGKVR
jgi:hypothetical protein